MKLFRIALVSAVALAQRKNNNYAGSRPQNPNKNYGKKPKYTTPAPTTTTTTTTTEAPNQYAAGNANSNYGATGAAYGDPHFMVSSVGQDPICFDYNPPAGSEMTLILDPENSLHVTAKVDGRRQGKTRFMTRVSISSPLGAQLSIDEHGVTLAGLPSWVDSAKPTSKDGSGIIEYGDIKYTETWSADGTRDKVTVEIADGPSFLIKEKALRETISFGITSTRGLSSKTRGVIGQFVKENAYTIEKLEEHFATIHIDDYQVDAVWDTFHRQTQCWTIEEDDLLPLFELSK